MSLEGKEKGGRDRIDLNLAMANLREQSTMGVFRAPPEWRSESGNSWSFESTLDNVDTESLDRSNPQEDASIDIAVRDAIAEAIQTAAESQGFKAQAGDEQYSESDEAAIMRKWIAGEAQSSVDILDPESDKKLGTVVVFVSVETKKSFPDDVNPKRTGKIKAEIRYIS